MTAQTTNQTAPVSAETIAARLHELNELATQLGGLPVSVTMFEATTTKIFAALTEVSTAVAALDAKFDSLKVKATGQRPVVLSAARQHDKDQRAAKKAWIAAGNTEDTFVAVPYVKADKNATKPELTAVA